ncbi:MAG: AraC family transcriptional regulator [Flavobacteriaceae bacterium]
MTKVIKNIAEGPLKEFYIEDGFFVLKTQNNSIEKQTVTRNAENNLIQFHYCLKGKSKFIFNQGRYHLDLNEENLLLLYNPNLDLPINLELQPHTWVVSVLISIKKFHSLFSKEAEHIHFLNSETKDKKYYHSEKINPTTSIILNQILNYNIHSSLQNLYLKAKCYELLSVHFNKSDNADLEQCPFLADEENILKIKRSKEIIISRMTEPPTLNELADEVGLSLKKLKEGFKQIYGTSVYSFLFDYKMEYARKLLETNKYNVNEIGLKVGYSTASHFISAFKKKYGTTPKKYS